MIEVLDHAPAEPRDAVAKVLEGLAQRVRDGVITSFRCKWNGDATCKLTTTYDLDLVDVTTETDEIEGDYEDGQGPS